MPYNPLAKDQIAANAVAAGTGITAYRQGKTGYEALNVGLWWRWWYKNLTFSLCILAISIAPLSAGFWWWTPTQALLNIFVFSITYVSLVDVSGFKRRLWYRLWAPIQHVMFPNVRRYWWYLLVFLPAWGFMWWRFCIFVPKGGFAPSPSPLPPEWSQVTAP